MQGIWAGVRERVEALSGLPGAAKVFGASDHRFVLAAPLTEEQLLSWETRAGTVLPDQFRAFLTDVAAAGAGPQYGLLGFEVTDGSRTGSVTTGEGRTDSTCEPSSPTRRSSGGRAWTRSRCPSGSSP